MRISKRRCKCTCVYTKKFFCFVSLFIKKLLMTPQGVDRADTVKAVYVLDKAHIAQSAHARTAVARLTPIMAASDCRLIFF